MFSNLQDDSFAALLTWSVDRHHRRSVRTGPRPRPNASEARSTPLPSGRERERPRRDNRATGELVISHHHTGRCEQQLLGRLVDRKDD